MQLLLFFDPVFNPIIMQYTLIAELIKNVIFANAGNNNIFFDIVYNVCVDNRIANAS
jgi:hypothetical protein